MERNKIISLVFSLLLVLTPLKSQAASFYAGPSFSFGGVIAESDFYNGATGWNPGVFIGTRFEILALDFFFKKFSLDNTHEANGAEFDITVTDYLWGMGFRLELTYGVDLLMGMAGQSVSTEYTTTTAGKELSPLLEKDYLSWYVGMGFRGELYPDYIGRLDMSFAKGDLEYSLLVIDFSVVYNFGSY